MKRNPFMYKTVERSQSLSLTTRSDKLGNILHCVEYTNNEGSRDYVMFKHLSSVIDFISTNFV